MFFEPIIRKDFEWINTYKDEDYEVFLSFDGKPLKNSWKPVRVRRVRADERQGFKASDFPWLGSHALVMRRRALDSLGDLLLQNGEILPLATEDNVELFVFNSKVLDALDEETSSVMRFPGTNRIMRVRKYEFIESKVTDIAIFRLPFRASPTFVSDSFVERYKTADLVGLEFKEVWNPI